MISIDLEDLSIAGHTPESFFQLLVFGANRTAIRDVIVNGKSSLRRTPSSSRRKSSAISTGVSQSVGRRFPLGVSSERGIDHLLNLIRIPSVSAMPNRSMTDYASSVLIAQGWTIRETAYTDEFGTEKVNLIAAPRAGLQERAIDLAFLCHTDTVPYAKDWLQALQPALRNRRFTVAAPAT